MFQCSKFVSLVLEYEGPSNKEMQIILDTFPEVYSITSSKHSFKDMVINFLCKAEKVFGD